MFYLSLQDYTIQPPTQELVVRDLHDNTWTFRHIYRGVYAFLAFESIYCFTRKKNWNDRFVSFFAASYCLALQLSAEGIFLFLFF